MKVLLFSNDLMPFGNLPTSGGGLRCWQLKEGLESKGYEVISSMPAFTYLTEKYLDKIPQENREYLWNHGEQDEIYRRVKPDAVLFASNWDHYALSQKPDVPLIMDLHGSRLVETTMWDTPVSTERKIDIFSKADCFLCAGTRQRYYFYGWLVQAGRVPIDEHFIRYIPVSASPEIPPHNYPDASDDKAPRFVSGGGWFPWQNQSKTIFEICNQIQNSNRGTIEIYGSPHQRIGNTPEELEIARIYERVNSLAESNDRIRVNGYIGRDDLLKVYENASVAVETMEYNIERELAFTTRTIEYLWCGLPVLYNNYAEISEHIAEYDAGWTIEPDNAEQIQATVAEIFSSPDLVKRKGENAKRLVQDRFTWDKTISPLVDFLQRPSRASATEPAFGTVYAKPAYLCARGQVMDVELASGEQLSQRFIVPEENIAAVEIPLSLLSEKAISSGAKIVAQLRRPGGRTLSKLDLSLSSVPADGRVVVKFPLFFGPLGGEEAEVEFRIEGGQPGDKLVGVQAVDQASFPLLPQSGVSMTGRDSMGQLVDAKALALSFVPGEYSVVYRGRIYFKRAVMMIKNGEWKRFVKAIRRRVPMLQQKVRSKAVQLISGGAS